MKKDAHVSSKSELEKWLEDTEREKKRRAAQIKSELAGSLSCEDEDIIDFMKANGILSVFHYIPLHSAPAGLKYGRFHGEDVYTTKESERLCRLPLYYGLKEEEVSYIISKVKEFYANR